MKFTKLKTALKESRVIGESASDKAEQHVKRTSEKLAVTIANKELQVAIFIKIDEFLITIDVFCITNDGFCIQNDGFCTKNDDFNANVQDAEEAVAAIESEIDTESTLAKRTELRESLGDARRYNRRVSA